MAKFNLDQYYDIYKNAKSKAKTQKKLTDFLREHQFVFIENHILETYKTKLNILPKHERYNFMVIQLKDGSLDDALAFGIKLKGKIPDKVHIYLNYAYLETWVVPLGVGTKNFKKMVLKYKYDQTMPPDLRRKWKTENEKLKKNRLLAPSAMYLKWEDHVTISD